MYTKKPFRLACHLVVVLLGAKNAIAEIATLEFRGEVIRIDDTAALLGDQVHLRTPVFASVGFDLETPDRYPEDPTRGNYEAPGWIKLDIGGLRFERTTWVQVDVLHHFQDQEYFAAMAINQMTAWPTPTVATDFDQILIQFWEYPPTYSMFVDDALPTTANFSPANYSHSFVTQFSQTGGPGYGVYFNLVQVPEPSTWLLFGMAVLATIWRTRRA